MVTASGHRDPFSDAHPLIQVAYFAIVLGVTAFCLHPLVLAVALIGGVSYGGILRGGRHVARLLLTFILPGMIVVTLINTAFNHYGVTLLTTLASGNSITLEAIVYGLALAAVLACGLCWFVAINHLITRDKIVYLCGQLLPSMGLLLSLAFRFVPLFGAQFRRVRAAQQGLGHPLTHGSWWARFRVAVSIFSIMTTWALETAVTTADAMRSRGYGTGRRTAYARFHFRPSDGVLAGGLALLTVATLLGWRMSGLTAQYNPAILIGWNGWTLLGAAAFGALSILPSGLYAGARFHRQKRCASAEYPPYFAPQSK